MAGYTKPQQGKKEKSDRLEGEGDQTNWFSTLYAIIYLLSV